MRRQSTQSSTTIGWLKHLINHKKWLLWLCLILIIVQYHLWFGENGLLDMWALHHQYQVITKTNHGLEVRNQKLLAQVEQIKHDKPLLDFRARRDLSMVDADEEYYQIVTVPTPKQQEEVDENSGE